MAFPTFVPPDGSKFSHGSGISHEPKVLVAGFGDGYEQRAGDGLNSDLPTLNVMYNVQTWVEGETIMAFFRARKGYQPFKFTLPGQSTPRKFICPKYSLNWSTNMTVDVSLTWKEVVDPE